MAERETKKKKEAGVSPDACLFLYLHFSFLHVDMMSRLSAHHNTYSQMCSIHSECIHQLMSEFNAAAADLFFKEKNAAADGTVATR